MFDYLGSLTTVRGMLCILLLTLVVWLLEASVYALVARSFGFWLSLSQVGVFVSTVNFASLAPVSPGGLGTIEIVSTEALVLSGLERETAFAMVVVQHALEYLFCLQLGIYYMHRVGFSLRGVPATLKSRTLIDIDDLVAGQAGTYQDVVRRFRQPDRGTMW